MAYNKGYNSEADEEKEASVFMDKYRLSFNILEQEGILIQQYGHLLRSLKAGYFDSKTITSSYDFLDCWTTLKGLYDFMRYNKLNDLRKNYKEEIKELDKLMEIYESNNHSTFDDLKKCYNLITKFISISGYHKDELENDIGKFPEPQNF